MCLYIFLLIYFCIVNVFVGLFTYVQGHFLFYVTYLTEIFDCLTQTSNFSFQFFCLLWAAFWYLHNIPDACNYDHCTCHFFHFYTNLCPDPVFCVVIKSAKAVGQNWRKQVGEEGWGVWEDDFAQPVVLQVNRQFLHAAVLMEVQLCFSEFVIVRKNLTMHPINDTLFFLGKMMA